MKLFTLLFALLLPTIAFAHVQLDHADPKVGSTVTDPPKEIKLYFDGPVGVDESRIDVTTSDGQSIAAGKLHGDEKDNTVLVLPVTETRGAITVKWNAYCTECHHVSHGTFTITVQR